MNTTYKIARDNIKNRRDKISLQSDSISNASIIKNQESDGIHILSEQMPTISNNMPIPTLENEDAKKENIKTRSILKILNKYKFWIIAGIILALLLFMAIKLYIDNQDNELEVMSVGNIEISSSNPTETPDNPLITILGKSKPSIKTSSVPSETFSTEVPITGKVVEGGAPSFNSNSIQIPFLQGPLQEINSSW